CSHLMRPPALNDPPWTALWTTNGRVYSVGRERQEGGSMRVLEHTSLIDLPDARVAICGDWHGDPYWLCSLTRAIRRLAPDIRTVFQGGDWWMDTGFSDRILQDAGIEQVLVTLGNH